MTYSSPSTSTISFFSQQPPATSKQTSANHYHPHSIPTKVSYQSITPTPPPVQSHSPNLQTLNPRNSRFPATAYMSFGCLFSASKISTCIGLCLGGGSLGSRLGLGRGHGSGQFCSVILWLFIGSFSALVGATVVLANYRSVPSPTHYLCSGVRPVSDSGTPGRGHPCGRGRRSARSYRGRSWWDVSNWD